MPRFTRLAQEGHCRLTFTFWQPFQLAELLQLQQPLLQLDFSFFLDLLPDGVVMLHGGKTCHCRVF